MAQGYNKIYDECYAEMSEEGKENLRKVVNQVKKRIAAHEADYNKNHRPVNDLIRPFRMNLGDDGIKELIVALMLEGYL